MLRVVPVIACLCVHIALYVEMQPRTASAVRRRTPPAWRVSESCPGQQGGSESGTARAKEESSDWHECVYSKQEEGLAGRVAITQECTLPSSTFFHVSLAGSSHPGKHQTQQHIVTLTLIIYVLPNYRTRPAAAVCVCSSAANMCLIS